MFNVVILMHIVDIVRYKQLTSIQISEIVPFELETISSVIELQYHTLMRSKRYIPMLARNIFIPYSNNQDKLITLHCLSSCMRPIIFIYPGLQLEKSNPITVIISSVNLHHPGCVMMAGDKEWRRFNECWHASTVKMAYCVQSKFS